MFDLKRPCTTCPFRKGVGETFRLNPARLSEIRTTDAFQCHNTIDYGGETQAERSGDNPQQCAGLMTVQCREGIPSTITRLAIAMGQLDPDELDPRQEVYATWADVQAAHYGATP